MDERRKEPRYAVRRDAFVWDFPGGGFHPVVVEDASRSGMQLQSKHSLQNGSQIVVNLKGMIVWGAVQYCRPLKDWFAAGIRIDHVDDRIFEGVLSRRNAATVYLGREGILAKDLSRAIPALRKNAARRAGMGAADKETTTDLMAARPQAIGGVACPIGWDAGELAGLHSPTRNQRATVKLYQGVL